MLKICSHVLFRLWGFRPQSPTKRPAQNLARGPSNVLHFMECMQDRVKISKCPKHLTVWVPPRRWSVGALVGPMGSVSTPLNISRKSTLKSRIFRHFCKLKWSLLHCSGVKEGLELKYITKITSIIGSDEILSELTSSRCLCSSHRFVY